MGDTCFRLYAQGMVAFHGVLFAKFLNHGIIHLAGDARMNKTMLGGISAYPFENLQGTLFKGVRTRFICWCHAMQLCCLEKLNIKK